MALICGGGGGGGGGWWWLALGGDSLVWRWRMVDGGGSQVNMLASGIYGTTAETPAEAAEKVSEHER